MKPTFLLSAISLAYLLFTIPVSAQQVPPATPATITDSFPKIKIDSIAAPVAKIDSLKITKKSKRKTKEPVTAYYPYYQPGNTTVKPLPYNSYRTTPKTIEKAPLPVADILRDIIKNKK